MEKNCSKCGVAFTCQSETRGCWCEQLILSKEVLQYLKAHYENCLCKKCLLELSLNKQGTESENQ